MLILCLFAENKKNLYNDIIKKKAMTTFIGGVHPHYNKITRKSRIEVAKLPKKGILPLQQHTGAVCEPLVKAGDFVKVGQKIAESKAFVSAPIHASISGKVIGIAKSSHPVLGECNSIIIESDGKIEWHESVKKRENADKLTAKEIIDIVKEAGIVGLGGAAFPTHVKLSPSAEKKIDTLILNGAECEPYLTCDNRLMMEKPDEIIKGLKLIAKALNASNVFIGIEDNKQDAAAYLGAKLEKDDKHIKVITLKTKYPEGAEKMLIHAITKRKVPAGGLPMDVGCVVSNVQTAKAVYDAVYEGKPLIERVVTITGDVNEPKNMLVKLGTPFKDLIEQCGGYKEEPKKIINGGPMMGIAQITDSVPVIKGISGIVVLGETEKHEEEPCIRCARCVDSCPMFLMPTTIAQYADKEDYDMAEKYFAMDCFECGCCAYICPSKIPLVEKIKKAKAKIMEMRK